jgi:hypothetical protein
MRAAPRITANVRSAATSAATAVSSLSAQSRQESTLAVGAACCCRVRPACLRSAPELSHLAHTSRCRGAGSKAGTLDDRSWLQPTLELYCDSAQQWFPENDQRQRFPGGLPVASG